MITLTIDNREVTVPKGTTVLAAADMLGIAIPRFCQHPKLATPGNCRMCVVEVEGAADLVISCREPVREGMVVRTDTHEVRRARADVLEFMLLNHPLDCPVCDQSGECALQEFYFEHSLKPSRFKDPKVRKVKAKRIGPHVMLDAERCVECTRCVRFCDEVVGRHEIGLYNRGDRTEIGVAEGREFSNAYSLCAVDICPVGALTSVDFRFKKRVWELSTSPTICTGCSRGCNVWLDHADGIPYRMRPRENDAVNGMWMCDAGRMTYKALLDLRRVLTPQIPNDGETVAVSWDAALARISGLVASKAASEVAVILSALASIEENEAFARLGREVLSAKRLLYSGATEDRSFGDAILRRAELSPNLAGVLKIAEGPVRDLPSGAGLVILEEPTPDDLITIVDSRPAWILLAASMRPASARWADVVLPRATHFEQGGTYVNCDGINQKSDAIFPLRGESVSGIEIARWIEECGSPPL